MVFLHHTLPVSPGNRRLSAFASSLSFGVAVFFLLSAYLITELLLRERELTGRIDVRSFYLRRALRIWPLYFLVLSGGLAISLIVRGGDSISAGMFASYLMLSGNWSAALQGLLPLGLGVLWSLNVEEQFYLVWPTIFRLCAPERLLIACGALWMASQCWFLFLSARHLTAYPFCYYATGAYVQYFAAGGAIAILVHRKAAEISLGLRVVLGAAGLFLFFSAVYSFHVRTNGADANVSTWLGYLLVLAGSVAIFFAFFGLPCGPRMKPLIYLGKISYGLYVLHLPIVDLIRFIVKDCLHLPHHAVISFVLGLPITIPLAMLSYRYYEKPFLQFKERFGVVKSRAA